MIAKGAVEFSKDLEIREIEIDELKLEND